MLKISLQISNRHCRYYKPNRMKLLLEYNTSHNIRAFSTYRGEGSDNYSGFNITHYCGDSDEHVAKCRKELCELLGINDKSLILPRQTHGKRVAYIDREFTKLTTSEKTEFLYGIDAIITDLPQTCIGVSTADCIPVLLYDDTKRVVAAVHAGWRGTVANIIGECISTMQKRYNSQPSDIKAIIGPGISLESFEVGEEVYEEFANAGFTMHEIAERFPAENGEKWHIDLWKANRIQMTECGIKSENIITAGICTYKHHAEFFSARRLGIKSGRIFNGIMLK